MRELHEFSKISKSKISLGFSRETKDTRRSFKLISQKEIDNAKIKKLKHQKERQQYTQQNIKTSLT